MRILSVNVGLPREVATDGGSVSTAIFKTPVEGRVRVRELNLDGDRQADLSVHGGPHKAVYAYPSEHYAFWREKLPEMEFPWGTFGENLTVEGILEDEARIGDRLRAGSVVLQVTQPRVPCYKLGIRFGRPDIPKRFLSIRRTGFYLAVVEEGETGAGDAIEWVSRDENGLTVAETFRLYVKAERCDLDLLRRVADLETLPAGWRRHFREQMEKL